MGCSNLSYCSVMLLILLVFLAKAPAIQSWGKEGHFITCKIAQPLLSKAAAKAVQELLPSSAEGDLASVCSWADTVRFKYRWASPLHYINTPGVCNYKYSRDCHNDKGEQDMCVAGAINNYTAQLITYMDSSSEGTYNLTESLMFLSHFVGDIHQPLHVGFADDEGGNTIPLRWFRRKSNLHKVWDFDIIDEAEKDFFNRDVTTMIEDLQRNITEGWSDEVPAWEKCARNAIACPDGYASEGISLACKWAYKDVTADIVLEDDYFLTRLPIVEKRLAQGGVRLAAILNRIFDSNFVMGGSVQSS
ncbi:hypothetical protein SUGI_0101160 [Cryptomeria japonica]|uniref:endonuclease 2 n=1 Tax=Cryptomeria japonica TaxID=3369 RepID=UPI002408EFAF|nr:endonuclease 2 [Cryptomeria japonica]GLJ09071.1 hypothetical protein SUGI_0101160 [Cryptomeria japonica]